MTENEFQVLLTNHYRGFTFDHVGGRFPHYTAYNPKCTSATIVGSNIPVLISFIDEIYDGQYPFIIIYE